MMPSENGPDPATCIAMNEPSPPAPITIVLADDHRVVRHGLRMLLDAEAQFEVVDETGDVRSALASVLAHRPRVLVLDLNLGGESGLDLIPQLRRQAPDTQIVVLTMQDDPGFVASALGSGAIGYVLKEAADGELMQAVTLAARGETYLNQGLKAQVATAPAPSDGGRPGDLSPREAEVLRLIALGHTNAEIAASLCLSVRTVESHRAHIQRKIGLTRRAELVSYARDNGLID